jgi:hypothetical protein
MPDEFMYTMTNAAIIRRFVDEVITEGKIDSAARYVREDIFRAMRTGFPDIRLIDQGANYGRR